MGTQSATFNVGAATPVITFAVANHTYGDAPFSVTGTSTSPVALTYSVVSGPATVLGSTATLTGAGAVVLQASQVANANYTAGTQSASFNVSAAAPVISFAVANHTFGDAPFSVAATSTSPVALTYSVTQRPRNHRGLDGDPDCEPGRSFCSSSQVANANYTAGTQNASFSVGVATPVISFAVPNHTFGDAPFSVTATSTSPAAIIYSVVSGPATVVGSTVTLTGAGAIIFLQASQVMNTNYAAGSQNASFSVGVATPVISFAVPNHTFGDAPFSVAATSTSPAALTYSVVSGPATVLGSTVTLTGTGSVVLQASQAADSNYAANSQTATFTVAAATAAITFAVP